LIFEIAEDEAETIPKKIKEFMQEAFELEVPLDVEMGLADNWLDAH